MVAENSSKSRADGVSVAAAIYVQYGALMVVEIPSSKY